MSQRIIYTTGSILFTTQSLTTSSFTTASDITHPYFANSNPANAVSMSSGATQIAFITASFISRSVSESMALFGVSTKTGSFKQFHSITQSSNGSASRLFRSIDRPLTSATEQATILRPTASIEMGFTGQGEWQIHKPLESNPGGISRGSERTFMFVSRSGRLGFKTRTPKNDIDFKADSIKFRSDDGRRELEFEDGKLITKKFNNREVGAAVEAETSGSEIVLTYSPGTFDSPTTASIGDVLGSIVWEDESLRRRFKEVEEAEREAAIGMRIKGVIDDANEDGTFIRSSMRFEIGSAESTAVTEYLRLEEGTFRVTSSGLLWVDNNDILQGNYLTDADRRIRFLNQTSNKRWTIGVDESQKRFIIHQGTSFSSNSDFEIDYSGNVVLAGSITATRGNFSSGIPTFTGSTIAINGGTF